jgi:hypothetical protein
MTMPITSPRAAGTEPPPPWAPYVVETDVGAIARALDTVSFVSGGEPFPLVRFAAEKNEPCVLISQGTGGHAYLFAELGYRIHRLGYNVFIMPKHGGKTIVELVQRHNDALEWVASACNPRIGIFGEGLGGFTIFYLALRGGSVRTIVCQNSPAILTEDAFRTAILGSHGAALRRRVLVPLARVLASAVPRWKLPISVYLDFRELVDRKGDKRDIEEALVRAYIQDDDFDRSYPLSAVASLILTPPPAPLSELAVPTMFLLPVRGFVPQYERDLFGRLPAAVHKKLVEVDGGVFWMVSHPVAAARVIAGWFAETL